MRVMGHKFGWIAIVMSSLAMSGCNLTSNAAFSGTGGQGGGNQQVTTPGGDSCRVAVNHNFAVGGGDVVALGDGDAFAGGIGAIEDDGGGMALMGGGDLGGGGALVPEVGGLCETRISQGQLLEDSVIAVDGGIGVAFAAAAIAIVSGDSEEVAPAAEEPKVEIVSADQDEDLGWVMKYCSAITGYEILAASHQSGSNYALLAQKGKEQFKLEVEAVREKEYCAVL